MVTSRSFLSDRMMTTTFPALRSRGLETRLGMDGRSVIFEQPDGGIVACDVVVEWAGRQPQEAASGTTDVIGIDGELQGRPGELVVDGGALFQLDGEPCEITVGARVDRGVAIASFRLSATGG